MTKAKQPKKHIDSLQAKHNDEQSISSQCSHLKSQSVNSITTRTKPVAAPPFQSVGTRLTPLSHTNFLRSPKQLEG